MLRTNVPEAGVDRTSAGPEWISSSITRRTGDLREHAGFGKNLIEFSAAQSGAPDMIDVQAFIARSSKTIFRRTVTTSCVGRTGYYADARILAPSARGGPDAVRSG